MKLFFIVLSLIVFANAPFAVCADSTPPVETPSPAVKPALSPEPAGGSGTVHLKFADLGGQVFVFSSGAGAWRTEVRIRHDGTFRGEFADSDAGDTDTDYPNGTRYSCSFYGRFSPPVQTGPQAYAMQCVWLAQEGKDGEERIVDGVREITSSPYGFDEAGEFFLYLPDTKVIELPGAFVDWVHIPLDSDFGEDDVLGFYGLYNVGGEQGFRANAEDPFAGVDGRFVGSWQAGKKTATERGERYALYGDGTFVHAASETGVLERELFKTGKWSVADGELRLAVEARWVLPVGPTEAIIPSDELVIGNEEVIKRVCNPPETETYSIIQTGTDSETNRGAITIDGVPFYNFDSQTDLMDGYYNLQNFSNYQATVKRTPPAFSV